MSIFEEPENLELGLAGIQQNLHNIMEELDRREGVLKSELEELVNNEKRMRQLIAKEKLHAKRLRRIADSMEILLRADSEEEILDVVAQTMVSFFPGVNVRFMAINNSHTRMKILTNGEKETCDGVGLNDCWAIKLGKAFVTMAEERARCKQLEGFGRAITCIPLLAGSQIIGVLKLAMAEGQKIDQDDLQFAELYINSVAMVLFNLRQLNSLQALSLTDSLTELPNRRFIMASLEREIIRSERMGKQFGLAMLDLDHFKDINDHYGHEEGDRTLALLADVGRNTLRGSDVLARFGGEEFLLLFPEVTREEAAAAVERLRLSFVQAACGDENKVTTKGVTFSAGLAMYPGDGKTPHALADKADKRLYLAKGAGRNCTVADDDGATVARGKVAQT